MPLPSTESVLGYSVSARGKARCIEDITAHIRLANPGTRWLACLNPHSYVVSTDDDLFSAALHSADWLIPDGIGIVIASKIVSAGVAERITGSDVFTGVMQDLNLTGGSVFFLGSTEPVLNAIFTRVRADFCKVKIVGVRSPPFKPAFSDSETSSIINEINAAQPDVLWVGMTSPKQDIWIYSNLDKLQVKFAAGVGAVFDFYSGKIERAHPLFQRIGLEWLYRFIKQPRHLWRRLFVSAPVFILHVMKAWFTGNK